MLFLIKHLPIGSSMDLHLIFSELFEKSNNENLRQIFYIFSAISFINFEMYLETFFNIPFKKS